MKGLSERGKALFSLIVAVNELGRLTAAPPNLPPARLQILRDGYKKALTDPALLKEMEQMRMDLDPDFGEEVAKLMKGAINQPEENIKLLQSLIKFE